MPGQGIPAGSGGSQSGINWNPLTLDMSLYTTPTTVTQTADQSQVNIYQPIPPMPEPDDFYDDSDSPQPDYEDPPSPIGSIYRKKQPLKFGNKIYNIPLQDAFPGKYPREKPTGEVGLEIECEGMNLFNSPIQFWTTHVDNSLRSHGDHPPIEYVLSKPISRDTVPKALNYLSKKLKEAGSTIDDSTRTSVHVHVNCLPLTIKQIYQYICLYMIFEELLVDFSGPGRPGNLFCLRAKDAEYNVQVLEQAVRNENFNEVFNGEIRYTACNTASLGKFGSLEFRSLRGTVDQELIQVWVDTLLRLKDVALKYDNPRDIVEDFLRLQPEMFLKKVFYGSDIYQSLRGISKRSQCMWDGLRLMRDVAYAVSWEKYDPELEKKSLLDKIDAPGRTYSENGEYYTVFHPTAPGYYYIVNCTENTIEIPKTNGAQGNWICSPNRKLLMRPNNGYHQQVDMESED